MTYDEYIIAQAIEGVTRMYEPEKRTHARVLDWLELYKVPSACDTYLTPLSFDQLDDLIEKAA